MSSSEDYTPLVADEKPDDLLTNKSFTVCSGPCLRCGCTDGVVMVRGANLCMACLRGKVSARYDRVVDPEVQRARVAAIRDEGAQRRMSAKVANRRKLVLVVQKAKAAKAANDG